MKVIFIFLSLALLILAVGCKEEEGKPPNVILLVIDSLPAGHLKSYGYNRLTSPTINQLAKESTVFERMYTVGGYSCPSFVSILTSKHPYEHGFTECNPGDNKKVPDSTLTLFDFFKSLNYKTGWFGSLDHYHINPDMGFRKSIDMAGRDLFYPSQWPTFLSFLKTQRPFFFYAHTYKLHYPYLSQSKKDFVYAKDYSGKIPSNYDELNELIAQKRNIKPSEITRLMRRKEFRNLIDETKEEDKKYLSDLFDDKLRDFDARLELLIKTLKEKDLWDNTILILTSDHGEVFGKRGEFGHQSLYEEVIHVPFMIKHPKMKPGRISTLVSTMDIFPTIASFFDSASTPKLNGESIFDGGDRRKILSYHINSDSIINWPWKLISWKNGKIELFNLEKDPSEKIDLSETDEKKKTELLSQLRIQRHIYSRNKIYD